MPDSPSAPNEIRWSRAVPELRSPILIAAFEGWNDAGDASTLAVQHLARCFEATPLAEIDPELYYDFSTTRPLVKLDQEQNRSLTWPTNEIVCARVPASSHDAVILCGIEPQLRWRSFCAQVLATAKAVGATNIVTLGALVADVAHTRPVEVHGVADDPTFMERLKLNPSRYEGPTGIVGVLSTAATNAGFSTTSLWASVPSYVPGAPSPKAALALVKHVGSIFGTTVHVSDLEDDAADYERQVDELVNEDQQTTDYVAELVEQWDRDESLKDDPRLLVAEVEEFLRDVD